MAYVIFTIWYKEITLSYGETNPGVVVPVEIEASHKVVNLRDEGSVGEELGDHLHHVGGWFDQEGVQRGRLVVRLCGRQSSQISLGQI